MEKILINVTKHLEITNERQKNLELKYENLQKTSEEFMMENKKLHHEIAVKK